MVDRVFGKSTIGGKTVGAMPLFRLPIIEAGRVHALTASLALAATCMNFHRHALPDVELIDTGAERGNGSHVLVARCEVLVERETALDMGGRAGVDDLKIGGADRHSVDADQHFRSLWHRGRLVA